MLRFFVAIAVAAATIRAWDVPGIFQINDPGCPHSCETSVLDPSARCHCPSFTNYSVSPLPLRIIDDCSGSLHGSNGFLCLLDDLQRDPSKSAFGGFFQRDDVWIGTQGCRHANHVLGACACPIGFAETTTRVLGDYRDPMNRTGIIGTSVTFCSRPVLARHGFWGGVWQRTDSGTCVAANSYTGRCACPPEFNHNMSFRVVTDGPEGSTLAMCLRTNGTPTPLPDDLPQATRELFVAPTGTANASDSNSGASPSTALATVAGAIERIANLSVSGALNDVAVLEVRLIAGMHYVSGGSSSTTAPTGLTMSMPSCGTWRRRVRFSTYNASKAYPAAILSGGQEVTLHKYSIANRTVYAITLDKASFQQAFVRQMWMPVEEGGEHANHSSQRKTTFRRIELASSDTMVYASRSFDPSSRKVVVQLTSEQAAWLSASPAAIAQANVLLYHIWTSSTSRIDSISPDGALRVAGTVSDAIFDGSSGNRFKILNWFDFTKMPRGTFLFNQTSWQVYYRPTEEEDAASLDTLTVIVPKVASVLNIEGHSGSGLTSARPNHPVSPPIPVHSSLSMKGIPFEKRRRTPAKAAENNSPPTRIDSAMPIDTIPWCQNVTFSGVAFMHTDAFLEEQCMSDGCSGQSGTALMSYAGVQVHRAQFIYFESTAFLHLGGYGLWIRDRTNAVTVQASWIADVGAGAMRIGMPQSGTGVTQLMATNIVVRDTTLRNGGYVVQAGCGILLQQAASCTLTHLDISEFDYTGISTGWNWGYESTSNENLVVSFNRLHHVGRGRLSDMGCIYNLGTSPGTVFDNNVCSDVQTFAYGGWGFYSDEGTSYVTWVNNIGYRTKAAPYHQHYGEQIWIVNNVFAFPEKYGGEQGTPGDDFATIRSSPSYAGHESHTSFMVYRNIAVIRNVSATLFYQTTQVAFQNTTFDNNVYWSYVQPSTDMTFPTDRSTDKSWTTWQSEGKDPHSVIQDPLFRNPDGYDFSSLDDASPARLLGFQPIDTSTVGPR